MKVASKAMTRQQISVGLGLHLNVQARTKNSMRVDK